MMTIDANLDKRLERVVRNRERMRRNGAVHTVGPDGLIRTRARLVRPRFPLKGAFLVVAILMCFKALLFAQLGSGSYSAKVEALRAGSIVEQAGAVLMQPEPVTVIAGDFIRQFFFEF
jgi:hypothetical protein